MARIDDYRESFRLAAAELKAAVIAEKRRKNPSYGTFGNIGAIFTED